jgi:nitroimidazol reductase NimA-like FMN-containing flavoprotein (pyridoxamine 5'-phosphate oxidase superfamily)
MVKTYHMRRSDKEIKDRKKLERILKETNFVTLALAKDNIPYVVSLSHSYDEETGCLYFHCSSEGKKLDFMRGNPVVWGQALIDHGYLEG